MKHLFRPIAFARVCSNLGIVAGSGVPQLFTSTPWPNRTPLWLTA